nr:MAG TPA: hypothetical protein [Caudoviricetes sp.]
MRVNEVLSRCRTDQQVLICYDNYHICGRVYDIFGTQEFNENRIGEMLVTKISANENELYLKAVSL